jgi:hypothetical protein
VGPTWAKLTYTYNESERPGFVGFPKKPKAKSQTKGKNQMRNGKGTQNTNRGQCGDLCPIFGFLDFRF